MTYELTTDDLAIIAAVTRLDDMDAESVTKVCDIHRRQLKEALRSVAEAERSLGAARRSIAMRTRCLEILETST